MSMNLHVEAVCGKVRQGFPLNQTPNDISYAAIEKGANPKQVYSDYIRQFDDDKDFVVHHLKALADFLEEHSDVQVNWFVC